MSASAPTMPRHRADTAGAAHLDPVGRLAGDVLDVCPVCTWWVSVDELVGGVPCRWCRGTP